MRSVIISKFPFPNGRGLVSAAGFTLIEALIVLSLLASLFLFSLSSGALLRSQNEEKTLIDEIRTAVQFAKTQAITLGHPVFLAPLDHSLDWSKGMILTQYNSETNTKQVLHHWNWQHPFWSLRWLGTSSDEIILSNNPMTAISNGQFILFNLSNKKKVTVTLNRLGRVKIQD